MTIKNQTNLIRDLLDPDLDTAEVVQRHNADPDDLRAAIRSPAFQTAAAAMREVDEARTVALLPIHTARALQRLARIAVQPAETTAQTESARRAATALIRGRSALRADASDKPASRSDPGCRADGEAFCTTDAESPCTPPAKPGRALAEVTPTPPALANRRSPDAASRPPSPNTGRPHGQAAPGSRHPTPGAGLTVADLLTALAARDPHISDNPTRPNRPARHPRPATASELLARAGTG